MNRKYSLFLSFFTALIVMIALGACTDHGAAVTDQGPGNVDQDTSDQDTANTGDLSFASEVLPIFVGTCANTSGCHGDVDTQHFLKLNSYAGVISKVPHQHVFPGNADISPIYLSVTRRFPQVGLDKRMPQSRDTLSTSDQQKIRDWINQGALNN